MEKMADAPTRGQYHHGDLRRALLEAALGLVSKKGAEGFSLREAAREVGVSPAAAYRHFEDKKALLSALARDGMWRLALAMEEGVASAPGAPGTPARAAAEMMAVGRAYVEFAVRHPSHFEVMFGPWCDHEDLTEEPEEARLNGRDAFQILVDTLDGMVRAGAVTPAAREGAEIAAWAAVHGLASLLVSEALPLERQEWQQALTLVVRTQLRGMGCDPGLLGTEGKRLAADRRCRVSRPPRKR